MSDAMNLTPSTPLLDDETGDLGRGQSLATLVVPSDSSLYSGGSATTGVVTSELSGPLSREGARLQYPYVLDPSGGSSIHAFLNLVKSQFGVGVLAIPHAFRLTGGLLGFVLYLVVGAVCIASNVVLLHTQVEQQLRMGPRDPHWNSAKPAAAEIKTYADLGHAVIGKVGQIIVQSLVPFLQFAFCCAFCIVMADTVTHLAPKITRLESMLITFPVLAGLSLVDKLKDLWFTSLIGIVVYLIGVIGTTIVEGASSLGTESLGIPHDMSFKDIVLAFGVIVYSLEGINFVLPVQQSLKSRADAPKVLAGGVGLYSVIVASYALYGFSAGFGHCKLVTECLEGTASTVVRVALVLALLVTHPLTLYVTHEMVESGMGWDEPNPERKVLILKSIVRVTLVAATCVVGWVFPDFSLFADVVGSFAVAFVGFVFPPILWMRLHGRSRARRAMAIGMILMAAMGVSVMVFGTSESVQQVIQHYRH